MKTGFAVFHITFLHFDVSTVAAGNLKFVHLTVIYKRLNSNL